MLTLRFMRKNPENYPEQSNQEVYNRSGLIASVLGTATIANTTETTLASYTLPGGSFDPAKVSPNGTIIVYAWGKFGATANNKTVKLYFGSTSYSTGVQTSNGGSWWMESVVQRSGLSTQNVSFNAQVAGTAIATTSSQPTESEAADILLKVTGTNGTAAANDIVCHGFIVTFAE
jgi:hypothetical protein